MYFKTKTPNQSLSIIGHRYATGTIEPMHQHTCHQLIVVKHGFIRVATPNCSGQD